GCSATSSFAYRCIDSTSPVVVQRVSIRILRPSIQPSFSSPSRNAAKRACPKGSSAASGMSTPIRRICFVCPRAARPWRRCTAAEQRDELAPLHVEHGDFLPYALLARPPTRALGFLFAPSSFAWTATQPVQFFILNQSGERRSLNRRAGARSPVSED